MTITAKVKKRMIDNGRIVHAIVQGESNATTIVFQIEGETDLVAASNLYLYLLYKRPNDQTVQVPILLDKTISEGIIYASFTPGAYFTADDGPVEISIIATESTAVLGGSGEVTNTLLWSSFPSWILVASSQLADSSTIIEQNVFTQYLAELEALNTSASQSATTASTKAGEASGSATTASNKAIEASGSATTASNKAIEASGYATAAEGHKNKAQEWAEKETEVETGKYSAKWWAEKAHETFDDLDEYVDETLKPALDDYEETKEGELDTYTATKKAELDTYEGTKETELNTYTGTKKSELDTYTGTKKGELDSYVANTNKPALDSYTNNTLKPALLAYEQTQEGTLNTYTGTKKTELDGYVTNTSKPSIDDYIDDVKKPEIDEYVEEVESQFLEDLQDVEDELTHVKNAIDANTARIENLEQEHGGLVITQYRGTDAVPSGKAKNAKVVDIVGKSRPWNNECKNGNFADDSEWNTSGMSVSYSNNKATLTTSSVSAFYQYVTPSIIQGHKYLYCANIETTASSVSVGIYRNSSAYAISSYSSSKFLATGIADIAESTSGYTFDLRIRINVGGSSTTVVSNVILRDLTLIFPEGVPSTVAECVQKCPDLLNYDSYGYFLVDTVVEGVESVGFNIWDEQTQQGYYNASGVFTSQSGQLCTKNMIAVKPLTTYYYKNDSYQLLGNFCYYDANGTFIARVDTSATFTTPANAYYLNISFGAEYGGSYANNICINKSDSLNGTYTPYWSPVTLSLPTPITLRSAGTVAEEFDLKTGEKTNPLGSANLGDYDWDFNQEGTNTYECYNSNFPKAYGTSNMVCNRLLTTGYADDSEYAIRGYSSSGTVSVRVPKNVASSPTALKQWLADNNVVMYYELATPDSDEQVFSPMPNTMISTEGGGTINTIQTQTTKIDNCMDVAYLAL